MSDLFEEVEEQLRAERYRKLARQGLPWILALTAIVLIAYLGVWGWDQYRQQISNKASEEYNAALEAASQGRMDEATKLWGDVAKSQSGAYKSLALMQLGGLKLGYGGAPEDTKGAVALFDQAAAAAPDDLLGDAARLKSALAILDTAPFAEVEGRLTPLLKDGHPYRVQAREALAFAKLMKGDTAGARSDFQVIGGTLDAPDSARQRANAAVNLIDSGSAKLVPAAVKAALAAPPPPIGIPGGAPVMPEAQEQAAPQQ